MSEVTTTVAELRPNDFVRFPAGEAGYVWATVCRLLVSTSGGVTVLFTDGGGVEADERTFPAERAVVRRVRVGEST
jgi:hypothetical protein